MPKKPTVRSASTPNKRQRVSAIEQFLRFGSKNLGQDTKAVSKWVVWVLAYHYEESTRSLKHVSSSVGALFLFSLSISPLQYLQTSWKPVSASWTPLQGAQRTRCDIRHKKICRMPSKTASDLPMLRGMALEMQAADNTAGGVPPDYGGELLVRL